MLVERFDGFGSSLDDFFFAVPISGVDAFFEGDLFALFIDRDAGIDKGFFFVVLAPSDDEVDAEGMRGLHDSLFVRPHVRIHFESYQKKSKYIDLISYYSTN